MTKVKNPAVSLKVKRASEKLKKVKTKIKRSGISTEEEEELLGEPTSYADGTDLAMSVYNLIQTYVNASVAASDLLRNAPETLPADKRSLLADKSLSLATLSNTLIMEWNATAASVAGKTGPVPADLIMSYFSTFQNLGLLNDKVIQTLSGPASDISELIETAKSNSYTITEKEVTDV